MNPLNLFSEIDVKDAEGQTAMNNRRQMLKLLGGKLGKMAITAFPFAVTSLFQKAYAGASPTTILGILNYALTLENLEQQFYYTALQTQGLIPTTVEYLAINDIRHHQLEHVNLLELTIQRMGSTPAASPKFDFTGGSGSGSGPYADVFSNYATFLELAQAFEDTGVRAYEGQFATLAGTGKTLTMMMNIHSVEARHASAIRQMRYNNAFATIKPWITMANSGISSAFNSEYGGEQNAIQANVQIVDINGFNINIEAATEAFDEPMSSTRAKDIIAPFIAS